MITLLQAMNSNFFTWRYLLLFSMCAIPILTFGQYNTNGDASDLGLDCYQLTKDATWESGTIFSQSTIDLNESFSISGYYNFGSNDLWGADGIVFMFATENDVVGDNGGYIGFQGISPSFGWEVDDFLNPSFGDPSEDHMAIMQNGSVFHNSSNNLVGPIILDNVEDGEDHKFCINWNAETHTFLASMDGIHIGYVGDIVNDIFGGDPIVYYGFSSATGTKTNEHTVCFRILEFALEVMEDVEICEGESVTLDPDPTAFNYTWDYDVSLSSTDVENPIASPTETTTYNVTMNFACGTATDEVTVFVQPHPEIEIIIFPSCEGMNFGEIDINTVEAGLTYSIDGNPVFSADTHYENLSLGVHTIDIIDGNGCRFQEEFIIESIPNPQLNLLTTPSCAGQMTGVLTIQNLSGGALTFSIDGWANSSMQLVYSDLEVGSYILDVRDENGCSFQSAFTIEEFDDIDISLQTTKTCNELENGSLNIFDGTLDLEYSIDNQSNWDDQQFYEDLAAGYHTLYIRSDDDCLDSLVFEIETSLLPEMFVHVYESACEGKEGGSVAIEIDDEYLIGLDDGPLTNIKIYENLSPGTHILNVQIDEDCILDFPFDVIEISRPNMTITTEPSCFGENNGSAEFAHDGLQFELTVWTDEGVQVDDLENLAPGEYEVLASHIFNCEFLYNFSISELDQPLVEFATVKTCSNASDGILSINNIPENSLIAFEGGEFSEETTFENLQAGNYLLEVMDQFSCVSAFDVEILAFDELTVDIPVESGDCFAKSTVIIPEVLSSHGDVEYLWNDGTTDVEKSVEQTEKLNLTISDLCESKDFEFEVNIIGDFTEEQIHIPNIFSPNEDKVNDCFQITVDPSINIISFEQVIFDRWGNKVFESDDIQNCWNGLFNNRNMEIGVYVYMLEIVSDQCNEEKAIRKVGDVTVFN